MPLYADILDICSYVDANQKSRCFTEGQKIIRANHIMKCAVRRETDKEVEIFSLCLRSTSINEPPHVIRGTFSKNENDLMIKEFSCSCLAGSGQACKHITAVMLFCQQNDVCSFEKASTTDESCSWDKFKVQSKQMYLPVPLRDFCCVNTEKLKSLQLSDDLASYYRRELMESCPKSASVRHNEASFKRKKIDRQETQSSKKLLPPESCQLLENKLPRSVSATDIKKILEKKLRVQQQPAISLLPEEEDYFRKEISVTVDQATEIALNTVEQSETLEWHAQREKRITGSKAYSLFTYASNKKPDWSKKLEKSPFFGNSATSYGLRAEKEAKEVFGITQKVAVVDLGFVIHPEAPWMGFSPDGIILSGDEVTLLEVKCPTFGQKMTATEVIKNIKYLEIKNSEYCLKKRHAYYGQVQLGMLLLNADKCIFIVYASFDKTYISVNVKFDQHFVDNLITKLNIVYFQHCLPRFMCK